MKIHNSINVFSALLSKLIEVPVLQSTDLCILGLRGYKERTITGSWVQVP